MPFLLHRPTLRPALALAIAGLSTLPAGWSQSAHAAEADDWVEPTGGCWAYLPAEGADLGDLTGALSLSETTIPWGENAAFRLTTSGATVQGGTRTWELTQAPGLLSAGPDQEAGTVTIGYRFTLRGPDGEEPRSLDLVTRDVDLPPAPAALGEVQATGAVDLPWVGATTVVLESVHVDLPGTDERLVCNGQDGAQAPENPLTHPVPTEVASTLEVRAATSAQVLAIDDQEVVGAARAGDTLSLDLAGFDSGQQVDVALCDPADPTDPADSTDPTDSNQPAEPTQPTGPETPADPSAPIEGGAPVDGEASDCSAPVTALADAAGQVLIALPVTPDDLAQRASAAEVRATGREVNPPPVVLRAQGQADEPAQSAPRAARLPLRLLATPGLSARQGAEGRVSLAGAEWDPTRAVVVTGWSGEAQVGTATLAADAQGAFSGDLSFDAATGLTRVVATQQRRATALTAESALVIAAVPATTPPPTGDSDDKDDKDDKDGDDTGEEQDAPQGSGTSQAPQAATSPAGQTPAAGSADLNIPAPANLPVLRVNGGDDAPIALVGGVAVMNAELVGEPTVAETFGAGARRTMRLDLQNFMDEPVTLPGLEVSISRGDDVEPVKATGSLGRLEAWEVRTVEVPVQLPLGSFGGYQVTGRIGDGPFSTFSLRWETQPWGLFGLNALAAFALAWAIRRRFFPRRAVRSARALPPGLMGSMGPVGAVGAGGTAVLDDGAAVIDLAALSRWWGLPEEPGATDDSAWGSGSIFQSPADDQADPADAAVVDAEAVDRWMARVAERSSPESSPAGR